MIKKKDNPVGSTLLTQEHTSWPSTERFNATPRFISRLPETQNARQFTTSVSATRYLTPGRRAGKDTDAVEDITYVKPYDSIGINQQEEDSEHQTAAVDGDDYKLEEPSSKRQRLSSSSKDHEAKEGAKLFEDDLEETPLTCIPILSSPPAPHPPISNAAPRFLLSTPVPPLSVPQLADSNAGPFLKPPRFRPRDSIEQEKVMIDPLPEQFSPHRRGQKYVTGGLAAEVRDWLFSLESAVPAIPRTEREDDSWLVKILVDETSGGGTAGMTMIGGRQVHSMGGTSGFVDTMVTVKYILAGEGIYTGLQKGSKVQAGKTVGIKGVSWEVVLDGQKWRVAVDWMVLF